jgi:hypothetical protein
MIFERREINIGSATSNNVGENVSVTAAEEAVSHRIGIQPTHESGRATDVCNAQLQVIDEYNDNGRGKVHFYNWVRFIRLHGRGRWPCRTSLSLVRLVGQALLLQLDKFPHVYT